MELKIANASGDSAVQLADSAFGKEFNEGLVHQVVSAYLAGGRAGTKAHKTRSQVRGGGAKPWRQKGTGRARAGSSRSPLWRGGGRTFAATPRDYAQKVNRKQYRAAMRAIVSELARQERFVVVEDFALDSHQTKTLLAKLKDLDAQQALIVVQEEDRNIGLASRNLRHVDVLSVSEINPVSLVATERVVITVPALKQIEEWLA